MSEARSESVRKMYTYPDREQNSNIHEVKKRKRFNAWYDENRIELTKEKAKSVYQK